MSVEIIYGNLLESNANLICHQVNCLGVMGSGVALQIKNKWPIVFAEYRNLWEKYKNNIPYLLGMAQKVYLKEESEFNQDPMYVINMFAQINYGKNEKFTNYEAFYQCLETIDSIAELNFKRPPLIAFPYKIGCDRGGANWEIIYKMIKVVLKNQKVLIYRLE